VDPEIGIGYASQTVMRNGLRRVLLHGTTEETFDDSLRFARRLVDTFGAELHVVYTVEEPLSAGWTAETTPDKLPELHQAIADEARERLGRIVPDGAADITIAIRTGDPSVELLRYTTENAVDLAIVCGNDPHGRSIVDAGPCSVLLLR
jgi:nucleotide-binding universal stress UspA family protein